MFYRAAVERQGKGKNNEPAGSTHSLSRALRPPEQLEKQAEFRYSDKTRPDSPVPTLQGPCGRSQKWRGSLRFLPPLEVRPSSVVKGELGIVHESLQGKIDLI